MSFPKYTQYKSSHVEWLGEIPAHWNVFRLKDVAEVMNGYPFDSKNFEPSGDFPLLRIRDLNCAESAIRYSGEYVASAEVTSADILVGMDGDFEVGRWYGREPALLNQRMCCIRTTHPALSTILEHALPTPLKAINDITYSTTVKHLSSFDVAKIRVALPQGDSELEALAAFLYAETRKIDTLIAEQERLLKLLAEKRQATISHAVTRGLNPDVSMKDSGVEWLGTVPNHWNVVPLAYRYDVQLGKMLDTAKINGNNLKPYLRVFDVQWGRINVDDLPKMDFDENARRKFRLEVGDILVNEGGSYPGRSAIWSGELDECYYQKALHRLRPISIEADVPQFFYYVLYWAANQGVFSYGGNETTIEHLPAEKLRRYRFAFPPVEEQKVISEYLKVEVSKLDALQRTSEHAVELLKERRSALISAAVTGKIDVREHSSAMAAAA